MKNQEPELPEDDPQTFCYGCNHNINLHGRFFFCRQTDEIICNRCLRTAVENRHCNACNGIVEDFRTHFRRGRLNAYIARNRRRRRAADADRAREAFNVNVDEVPPEPIPPEPVPPEPIPPEPIPPEPDPNIDVEEPQVPVPPAPPAAEAVPPEEEADDQLNTDDGDEVELAPPEMFECKLYSIHEPRSWSDYFYHTLSTMEIAGVKMTTLLGVPEFECDNIKRIRVRLHTAHPLYAENFKSYFMVFIRKDLYEKLSELDSMNVSSETYYSCGIEHLQGDNATPTEKSYAVLARFQHMLALRHLARGLGARVGIKMPN